MEGKSSKIQNARHSMAHILAMAVIDLFKDVKLAIGPVIENGFYYDFDLKETIKETDLPKIEKRMREIINQKLDFKKHIWQKNEALKYFKNAPYKIELIKERVKSNEVQVYQTGNFYDFCKGGHIKNTSELKNIAFKIEKIAGAYWKGSEKNPMLQRIYGIAFESKDELANYLKMQEEAKKRDHRKIGRDLELFMFDDKVGAGLPLWLPNGTLIIEELEKLAIENEKNAGYMRVRTPHIAKESLYLTSGHLPYYKESMFPPIILENEKYYLKAMNCPHHHLIYNSRPRSYRELPLRIAEYGTCYRYEQSGTLLGLMRVRMMQMNDAHIYCALEQFEKEFLGVCDMYLNYFKLFGISKYQMRFSTHDKKELGKKYVNEPKLWQETEDMVRKVLKKNKINYIEVTDEAAFYGPKIDVEVWSVIGREFTLATNQVDFSQPRRFNLSYTDNKGRPQIPIIIHRAPLGTHERFIGFLIEHYAGNFPLWLAPIQANIIPISEKNLNYARKVFNDLKQNQIRVKLDENNETLSKKIRNAELQKIPYIIIVGDKEENSKKIAVRERHNPQTQFFNTIDFIKLVSEKIENRTS